MAADIMGTSGRSMVEALIAGERDTEVLAGMALGRMRSKHAAHVQALTRRFDEHHAELAWMPLDGHDALSRQIDHLGVRIDEHLPAPRRRTHLQ